MQWWQKSKIADDSITVFERVRTEGEPFKRQPHKMDKHTERICRQFADELFECVWPFCGVGA